MGKEDYNQQHVNKGRRENRTGCQSADCLSRSESTGEKERKSGLESHHPTGDFRILSKFSISRCVVKGDSIFDLLMMQEEARRGLKSHHLQKYPLSHRKRFSDSALSKFRVQECSC